MDKYRKLAEMLRGPAAGGTGFHNAIINARVVSVEEDFTCTVEIDSLQISGVRLKATPGGENWAVTKPKAGTSVLVGSLSGDLRDLVVLLQDEPEKVAVQAYGASLKEQIEKLMDILIGLIITTPAGTGNVFPQQVAELTKVKAELMKIFE